MFFFTIVLFFSAHAVFGDEFVVTLTSDNFTDFLNDNPKTLVEFYAPWCGHCKQLAPVYEQAAQALAAENSIAKLVKVDATVNQPLAQQHGVQGYPTLKWFDNGSPSDYDGGRDLQQIVGWVRSRVLPALETISRKSAETYGDEAPYVVIAYVKKDSKKEELFDKFCDQNRGLGYLFAKVTKKKGKFVAVLRRNRLEDATDGEKELTFKGKVSGLLSWLSKNRAPNFIDSAKSPSFMQDAFAPDYVTSALFIRVNDKEEDAAQEKKTIRAALSQLVPSLRESRGIVTILLNKDDKEVGVVPSDDVGVVFAIKEGSGFRKYRLLKDSSKNDDTTLSGELSELSEENLKKFIGAVDDGKWNRYLKNTAVESNMNDNVVAVDAQHFDEIVYDENSDVLVEFYAPWCGHCKQLAPLYEKFGAYVKQQYKGKNLVVAKIDATNNEVDEQIQGFPTLLFYPAGAHSKDKLKGIKFEGDWHDQDELVDFLDEYAVSLNKQEL